MITDKIKKTIEENPVALATVNSEGNPNVIAVAYVKVEEDKIIITDNNMKITKENIIAHPVVCLTVWDDEWNGYKVNGNSEYHDSGKWLDFVKTIEQNEDEPTKGAVVITPKDITKLS